MRLKGKRAVVTGSSAGIGRSIAIALAAEGVSVVINARGRAAIDAVVAEIRDAGGRAEGIAGSVSDPVLAEDLIGGCVDRFGGIDILVNNAGVYDPHPAGRCSLETWRETMATNLDGAFHTIRAAIPHMTKQRWGRILNAGSQSFTGINGAAAYPASKAALVGLTRAVAADYGRYGVTANVYNPEALTAMGASNDREAFKGLFRWWKEHGYMSEAEMEYKFGVGAPDGVAPWVVYLCSDAADRFNGEVFAVEGRRIALLARPEEIHVLWRDTERLGPWSQDELGAIAPTAIPGENRFQPRDDAALESWETTWE